MKIIEAMKQVKANKEKIADLHKKIAQNSAHLDFETPVYPEPAKEVSGWLQSCLDLSRDNVGLLVAIARTNLATSVTIELGGKSVTKTIAEWVWRRREYAAVDVASVSTLTDRNLKEGTVNTSTGVPREVKITRNYDPKERDRLLEMYRSEKLKIDSALEVTNATTDLIVA